MHASLLRRLFIVSLMLTLPHGICVSILSNICFLEGSPGIVEDELSKTSAAQNSAVEYFILEVSRTYINKNKKSKSDDSSVLEIRIKLLRNGLGLKSYLKQEASRLVEVNETCSGTFHTEPKMTPPATANAKCQ